MKKRYIEPIGHKSIDDYKFKKMYIDTDEFKGHVGCTDIKHVLNEWHVQRDDGTKECILKSGYKLITLYPDDSKYAITAFYNEKKEIIEWYFDMVKEFGEENGLPYMMDLYLDLVITKSGEVYILDEDELLDAVKTNDITKKDYELAHNTLDMLLEKYDNGNNISELRNLTNQYLGDF